MYQYVHEAFLSEPKYAPIVAELENRLTDLGIHGRTERLHPLKSVRDSVTEALRRGVKTIVAVGSDETVKRLLDVVPGKPITLGYIPLVSPSPFADILGIPFGIPACDILSARLTEFLDIGRVNGQYFLGSVLFSGSDVRLECDGLFRANLPKGGQISVCNIITDPARHRGYAGDPCDGMLDVVLSPATSVGGFLRRSVPQQSIFSATKVVAQAEGQFSFSVDGKDMRAELAAIEVADEKVKMIVGKARRFLSRAQVSLE